jgi:hypothetical protein
MVSGFIASREQRTETIFEIRSCKPLIGIKRDERLEEADVPLASGIGNHAGSDRRSQLV